MNGAILGAAIRSFRHRRLQLHSGKPWTLEDLAVASDGDAGHLSRIERGAMLPSRATLLRIAQALELTLPETEFLLRSAGFAPLFEPPGAEDAARAARWLATRARGYLEPLTLYSIDMRIWAVNALWLRLMGMTPAWFRACMQGREMALQFAAPCSALERQATRFRDFETLRLRSVARLRTAAIQGHIPQQHVERLLAEPGFRARWEQVESAAPSFTLSGEQSVSEIDYPGQGVLRFDNWWCPLQIDPRFLVILHLPHDPQTRQALVAIRHEARPREGAPCPAHGYRCAKAAA